MGDELRVTVVATGLGARKQAELVHDADVEIPVLGVGTGTDGIAMFQPSQDLKPESLGAIGIRGGRSFNRGGLGARLDSSERDVPAYLRKQAN